MKEFFKSKAVLILVLLLSACRAEAEVNSTLPCGEALLSRLGWECGALIEVAQVKVPAEQEDVYRKYNKLQLQNGYDLAGYGGKQVTRYTYEIKNHPDAQGRQVLANILAEDGQIIGGDIMVTAIDGFMHGLCPYPGG